MKLRTIACLPRVAMEPDTIDLGHARIVHLPFQQWLAFEGQTRSAQYDHLGRRYNEHPPVFWETVSDADPRRFVERTADNTIALWNTVEAELEAFIKALHWYTGRAPIHPRRSAIYFAPRSADEAEAIPGLAAAIAEDGVPRLYGESEKEYATQNDDPAIVLRQQDLPSFKAMLAFARQTQPTWAGGEYALASQSLALCSTPGLDWQSQMLLLVGAYESLLLPGCKDELQRRFERRFSCLAASGFDEIARYRAWIRFAYRLRSDLIHGRPLDRLLHKMPSTPMEYIADSSRAGVRVLCRLIRYRHGQAQGVARRDQRAQRLWDAVDLADASPEGFAGLQALIGDVSSPQWLAGDTPC